MGSNNEIKLNINNYVDDNVGSTIFMNTRNKILVNITDQTAGAIYLDSNNKLRLGSLCYTDSLGHFYFRINENHALDYRDYKLNLNILLPLTFVNKNLTLSYNPYFKLSNDKLDLDITKLQTDIVIQKTNEGIKLNNDGTFSIDRNVLTSMINVCSITGLKILGNELIIDKGEMSRNLIRLNCKSPIVRRDNNNLELRLHRDSID